MSQTEHRKNYMRDYIRKYQKNVFRKKEEYNTEKAKEERREYNRNYQKKRRELIDQMKGNVCSICDEVLPSCCLDFHHRDGEEKVARISQLVSCKTETLLAEIAKCDVVCANCHRKIHHLLGEDTL